MANEDMDEDLARALALSMQEVRPLLELHPFYMSQGFVRSVLHAEEQGTLYAICSVMVIQS